MVTGIFLLAPPPPEAPVQAASFNSIEVPTGGHVILRPSPTQRVTLVRGSPDYTRWHVTERGALVIERCYRKCPRGYRSELEILTPILTRVSLANGGTIQVRGTFPRQPELSVAVSNGGTIDVRSMPADRVTASVEQGGRILTLPRASLVARVSQGGAITWWGDAQVSQSVEHGGVVNKGEADEIDLPLSEVALPLLHPIRKHGSRR
jgi:hypothetical protein